MFEQMIVDCGREGSLGKLDNAKELLPCLPEAFGRYNTAKVRAICAVTFGNFLFHAQVKKSKGL